MKKLTICIPAREEEFLDRTIQDVLEHTDPKLTKVIAVLDGYLPNPPLSVNDPRVTIIYHPISKGQRASVKEAVKLADTKYVCKLDAHCSLAQGFDTEMIKAIEELGDNTTLIPLMRNLHAFDWVCPQGHRKYQGKDSICLECSQEMTKDVVWIAKESPSRFTFTFDTTMHFQYDGAQAKKPESLAQGNYRETLSIQGSCYMMTKDKYIELDMDSDEFHSWGQNGVEVACKTWLSGGQVIANLNTWYAHMFRTNNFGGFPYSNPQSKVNENRELSRELFQRDKWPGAIRKFQWLLDKFDPPGWEVKETKGIIYYTDLELDPKIAIPVQNQLVQIGKDKQITIVTASLRHKLPFGQKNIFFPSLKRSYHTLFKQVLGALENSTSDIIFFTEHDVYYHPTHFDFVPPQKDTFYYNQNVYYLMLHGHLAGRTLHYDVNQLSGLCVYRETALTHFKERLAKIEKEGFSRNMGFEPFTHGRIEWENKFKLGKWMSEFPNIDIRHGTNSTNMRFKKWQYRNQHLLINWIEGDSIPGWGKGEEIIKRFL